MEVSVRRGSTVYYFDSAYFTCDQKHVALEDLILLFTCFEYKNNNL